MRPFALPILGLSLFALACGGSDRPPEGDAAPGQDTGSPGQDTGAPAQDTGAPAQDTGAPVTDSGGGSSMLTCPGDGSSACQTCSCDNCMSEIDACAADEGCVAIGECAVESMCVGFACLTACGDVIDQYGGIGGQSAALGLELSNCIESNCAASCGG